LNSSNKIVHSLWIGKTLSNVELLTVLSFIANGHDFYLWTYETIETDLPKGVILKDANSILHHDKIFRYKNKNQFGHGKGSLAGFSDIFRYKLLYEQGGWWIDMDVTCLKPFDFEEEYVFRKHHELNLVGNMMKCPQESELMRLCYEKAYEEVDENNTDWHKPINILNEFVKKLDLEIFVKDFSNQDIWADISVMIYKRKKIPNYWCAIHWANEEWRRNNINKNYFFEKSLIGDFMLLYDLTPAEVSLFYKFIFYLKLTHYYRKVISVPDKIISKIKWYFSLRSD
jgi:hypothetical protein